jgi:hypothetical protein
MLDSLIVFSLLLGVHSTHSFMETICENLRRAQEAIARARELSSQLSSLCLPQNGDLELTAESEPSGEPGPSTVGPSAVPAPPEHGTDDVEERVQSQPHEAAEQDEEEPSVSGRDVDTAVATLSGLAGPVRVVAAQLASLQRKQNETLQQLLVLRMQQLK